MNEATKPLLERTPGAVWMERNRRELARLKVIDSPDIRVERSERGAALFLVGGGGTGGGAPARVRQFRLKDFSPGDYLLGAELTVNDAWDGDPTDPDRFTEDADQLAIAKPWWLRQSEFDGITVTVPTEWLNGSVIASTDKFYRYTYYSANFRLVEQLSALGGSVLATEYECVLPRAIVNEEIVYAVESEDLQMDDDDGEPITLLAVEMVRVWARASSPTSA